MQRLPVPPPGAVAHHARATAVDNAGSVIAGRASEDEGAQALWRWTLAGVTARRARPRPADSGGERRRQLARIAKRMCAPVSRATATPRMRGPCAFGHGTSE